MQNYLKEALKIQTELGVDASFEFNTNYAFEEKNNIQNVVEKNIAKPAEKKEEETAKPSENAMKKEIRKLPEEPQIEIKKVDLSDVKTFDELVNKIKDFDGCQIKKYSTNTVVFDGNKDAKIMLIGEAPGENEDKEGIPFCGQSGQLLRKAIGFIGLDTKNSLITNTLYWRPPENRKPTPQELEICRPFLEKMISIVKPKIIILSGGTAINHVLKAKGSTTSFVGKLHNVPLIDGIDYKLQAFALYHPSYLLRSPSSKKPFWEHLLLLKQELKNLQLI